MAKDGSAGKRFLQDTTNSHISFKIKLAAHELYTIAVIVMIIDHIGFFFFPGHLLLRALRFGVIFWFLPLGYNAGRRPTLLIWQGVVALEIMQVIAGGGYFPLSALATIIGVRYVLPPLASVSSRGPVFFWGMQAVLLAAVPYTYNVVQYGTSALLIAMAGWVLREREMAPDDDARARYVPSVACYFSFVWLAYNGIEEWYFRFPLPLFLFVLVSTGAALLLMTQWRQMILNDLKNRSTDVISRVCRAIGHKTLEIYVLHLLIFMAMFIF